MKMKTSLNGKKMLVRVSLDRNVAGSNDKSKNSGFSRLIRSEITILFHPRIRAVMVRVVACWESGPGPIAVKVKFLNLPLGSGALIRSLLVQWWSSASQVDFFCTFLSVHFPSDGVLYPPPPFPHF